MKVHLLKLMFVSLLLLAATGHSFAQAVPNLAVEKFENKTYNQFDDGSPITSEAVKKGFDLFVKKTAGVIHIEHPVSSPNLLLIKPSGSNATHDRYHLTDPPFENDCMILIKIVKKDKTFRTITLNVKKKPEPADDRAAAPAPAPFDPATCANYKARGTLATNPDPCKEKTYEINFGEEPAYYDDNKIVYVYDFNKDPAKRMVWKITKDTKTNALITEVANFSKVRLLPGWHVQFKIVNINKFLYNVSVNDTIVSLESEASSLFNRIFLGDPNLLGKLLDVFTADVTEKKFAEREKPSLQNIEKDLRCFIARYNGLHAQMLQAYNPCSSFPCCSGLEPADYQSLANDLLNIKIGMAVVFQNLTKDVVEQLKKKKEELEKCRQRNTEIKTKLDANAKERKPIEDKPEDKRTLEEKNVLAELLAKKAKLEQERCANEAELQEEVDALETETKYFTAIIDLQNNTLPSEQDLRKMIVFLNNVAEQNNTHVTGPFALRGNALELTVDIRSNDSITKYFSLPAYNNKPLKYRLPIVLNPFVSFSAGSFVGSPDRLRNKTYVWQQVADNNRISDTAKYFLVESGYSAPPVGFAALVNGEWKFNSNFGAGFSAGAGITIENEPRPAYLLGVSLFFGDTRQLAITGGLAGMQVNRISNNLQAAAQQRIIYQTKPATIEYYKEFKLGPFLSLTFTPFTTSKQ